ncbi:energy transducer TonB [Thermomonas sp.]|uniref:energy transducer TonB n=1 Tax=Thermomonas sp. TaxID=1971895 RepID=UPI0026292DE2|nr:energy transducer TonB [Thermomonas sp.]
MRESMKKALRGLLAAAVLAVFTVPTTNAAAVDRTKVESSLRVGGFVTIAPDGSVAGHELDSQAQLSPALTAFIDRAVAHWRFSPVVVDGQAVRVRVPMSLRLVLRPTPDGNYEARIASTWFMSGSDGAQADTNTQRVARRMQPPVYPTEALRMGGKGVVYLNVTYGPDGKVTQVYARQVNLRVLGTEAQMDRMRDQFAEASIRAARRWVFAPPTTGKEAERAVWSVVVPVDFRLSGEAGPRPGEWETYVPGPIRNPPGQSRDPLAEGSPDALPDSGVYSVEQSARLLTPPAA